MFLKSYLLTACIISVGLVRAKPYTGDDANGAHLTEDPSDMQDLLLKMDLIAAYERKVRKLLAEKLLINEAEENDNELGQRMKANGRDELNGVRGFSSPNYKSKASERSYDSWLPKRSGLSFARL